MRMILAVMYREFLIRTTSLTWAFADLIIPLSYLLLFGVGLDRALGAGITADGRTVEYNAFFLAGVLSMSGFGFAINTSYGFFVDRDNGILYEFLTYPMTRGEFLFGKILFNSVLAIVQAIVTVTLAALFLGIRVTWETAPLILPGVVLGTAGWFFFLSTFALRIRRNDMFNTLINLVYFFLMFGSSLFYPVAGLPLVLRAFATVNPLTWHTDVLRYITIGVGDASRVLVETAAFALFTLGSFFAAVRTLQRGILK